MALTPEKIHAEADKIAEAGDRPTLARVRKALGGGSFSTISEAMQAWREKQTEEHALAEIEVPEPINERVEQLKAAAWEAAVAEAERRLSAERAALDEAQAQATGEVEEAREAVQTLEEEAAERDRELEALRGKLAEAERGWREAEQQREAESARLSERLSGL
ncbi:DNA-binding protein, partial [Halomonas piscis]|uniref:DNA-binding protein n=1 Tax=Halomonas piscis TaxID=3031727 RepID=UPI002897E2D9